MLIFLYGQDTFRLSRKLAEIIGEYKKQTRGLDFAVFDALADTSEDFFSKLNQNSLFSAKKFFVIKNPVSNKNFKEALIARVKEMSRAEHNVVFYQEGKVLKADRLLKILLSCAQVKEFTPLAGARLNAWIAAEFKKTGNCIGAPAIEVLSARVGGDLWRARNEIQKLAHFWSGQEISVNNVERTVALSSEANIFAVVDAAAARDKKKTLFLLKDHIDKGSHPVYLLALIASQFKNLLLVKDSAGAATAARLGIHPYVFGKTLSQARRFSLFELREIYRRICQTDFDVKTGKVDSGAALDLLAAAL